MQQHHRLTDAGLVVGCVVVGAGLSVVASRSGTAGADLVVDAVAGLVACVSLGWRRRLPVAVAAIMVPISVVSFTSSPAMLVSLHSLGGRRGVRTVVAIGAGDLVAVVTGAAIGHHRGDQPLWQTALVVGVVLAATIATGLYTQARRDLVTTLRERADQLEREKQQEADRARRAERERVAQEMHDVIAHRLALISLHAGVLQVDRAARDHPTIAEGASFLQTTAQTALRELRDVIGVLRSDDDLGDAPTTPQPALSDVAALVEEARTAGLRVDYRCDPGAAHAVPDDVGRHVHRVVQEGLTNLARHAPTSVASVVVAVPPAGGVELTMDNELDHAPVPATTGGSGLIGLHERVTRAGGTFTSGVEGSRFVLRARWTTR